MTVGKFTFIGHMIVIHKRLKPSPGGARRTWIPAIKEIWVKFTNKTKVTDLFTDPLRLIYINAKSLIIFGEVIWQKSSLNAV